MIERSYWGTAPSRWMANRKLRTVRAAAAGLLLGCASVPPAEQLRDAQSVHVIRNASDTIRVLDTAADVQSVAEFFLTRPHGWREQWPIARGSTVVRINFKRANGSSGGVEVGPGLVRYWHDGDPIARSLSPAEQETLAALLKVDLECIVRFGSTVCVPPAIQRE